MAKTKKRADGLYQKQIIIGRNSDGSYKRKSVYAKTLKELDEKLANIKHQIQIGIRIDDDSTFLQIANVWLDNYRVINNTPWATNQRRLVFKYLIPCFGDGKVKNLTKFDLQTLINKMRDDGYSTSTMKKVRDIAVQIMAVAVDKKIIVSNPFKGVIVPEVPKKERRALSDNEIALISQTWQGHRLGYAALTMLYCGIRRGELLALDWKDIDFENRILHITKAVIFNKNQPIIKQPKSKAGIRDIPIPDFLIKIYKSIPKESSAFLTTAQGERMTGTAYKRAWDSYENYLNTQAGGIPAVGGNTKCVVIDHITAHMLRHTYASLLYEAGVDVKSAQRFLGHSDIETNLEIYTHLTRRKEAEAVKSINSHFEDRFINGSNNVKISQAPKHENRDEER